MPRNADRQIERGGETVGIDDASAGVEDETIRRSGGGEEIGHGSGEFQGASIGDDDSRGGSRGDGGGVVMELDAGGEDAAVDGQVVQRVRGSACC